MPAKNRIKQYTENSHYHIYNRGVEKRNIFLDQQDYAVFLSYLKEYLLPKNEKELIERLSNPDISLKERGEILKKLRLNNFSQEINLLTYCLMPNHFHFLIKQKGSSSIDLFMNSFASRYARYFNLKYKRVGSLYQGVYKAVLITDENQFLHVSRYIHKQALILQNNTLKEQPSSYLDYLGARNTTWIHPEEILNYFSKINPNFTYEEFLKEGDDLLFIKDLILEEMD